MSMVRFVLQIGRNAGCDFYMPTDEDVRDWNGRNGFLLQYEIMKHVRL